MLDDATLLRRYAESRSEPDFAELVRRHLNLVYSVALRQVNGDSHLARDITQLVFTDLAQKAGSLVRHPVLAGWLFTSARYAAAKVVRGERRRHAREQEAFRMQASLQSDPSGPPDWDRVRPVLDEALGELGERDRLAILLRFFEGRDYAGIGAQLSLTDNAARMRVDRAVDKLRGLLQRRGIVSTSGALAAALTAQAVTAAPAGLAATVTSAALATPAAATTVLTFMSITKLQASLAAAVLATGTGFYLAEERHNQALRAELAALAPAGDLDQLRRTNLELARAARTAQALEVSDEELARLQEETAAVQATLRANARAQADARRVGPTAEIVDIARLDRRPVAKKLSPPAYPLEMARNNIPGEAVVEFVIGPDGTVTDARIVRSSHKEFEAPALEAIKKWEFSPGQMGDRVVGTRLSQSVRFTLANEGPADWF